MLFVHSSINDDLQQHVKMRSWIGTQHKKYPYPHLTLLEVHENETHTKYHMDHFKADSTPCPNIEMRKWMAKVLTGMEAPFRKSEKFESELNPENVFESIGYDNLASLYDQSPFSPLVLYVISSYVDEHLLDLNDVVSQTGFPAHARNYFLKISHTSNDLLPGMTVKTLPQLVLINEHKQFEYL